MGLPQIPANPAPSNNSHSIIFGILGFFILYAILHFLTNNQRKKVASGYEKINLREHPDRNVGGMM